MELVEPVELVGDADALVVAVFVAVLVPVAVAVLVPVAVAVELTVGLGVYQIRGAVQSPISATASV